MAEPVELTEDEIAARLDAHPELVARLLSGDTTAFGEVLAAGTGAKVVRTTIRELA